MMDEEAVGLSCCLAVLAKRRRHGLALLARVAEDQALPVPRVLEDVADAWVCKDRRLVGGRLCIRKLWLGRCVFRQVFLGRDVLRRCHDLRHLVGRLILVFRDAAEAVFATLWCLRT